MERRRSPQLGRRLGAALGLLATAGALALSCSATHTDSAIERQAQAATVDHLIDATYDDGMDGFGYFDDAFEETNAPTYAHGTAQNGELVLTLGGLDNTRVNGMSGGFYALFGLDSTTDVTVSFDYVLAQSCWYESDESSEIQGRIGGLDLGSDGVVARVTGGGGGCPGPVVSGTHSETVTLGPGAHDLVLGGYNDKKTYDDETTEIRLDNVRVSVVDSQSTVLVDARFDSGLEGFAYADDSFRATASPAYASGAANDGRLEVDLGGIDNSAVVGMSGGFLRTFTLVEAASVTFSFDYTLDQSCPYESDESSELLFSIDGQLIGNGGDAVARVTGNGNSCPGAVASGTFTTTQALSAGLHTITLGAYNDKKTFADETTTASIDNVLIATDSQCTPSLSAAYDAVCASCGGAVTCAGSCSTQLPSNLGAPCGSCGGVVQCDGSCSIPSTTPCQDAPSTRDRLDACALDPRVAAGLVSLDICAGADLFFRETFEGNGRTCASCHPVVNNYTIDPGFVGALHAANPLDPLFVNEFVPELAGLETSSLVDHAGVLENVDGFQDPENRFVTRSVPHLLSISQTIGADPADASGSTPVERTGWSGDGAPDDGSLNSFLKGAITQHFTRSLARVPGVDFRLPTQLEADLVEGFQLSLGRQSELDLASVRLNDQLAEQGREAFIDPLRATCGICHANAGSNFVSTGLNRNFDNGQAEMGGMLGGPLPNGGFMSDGGFGGADLEFPNVDTNRSGVLNGFGDLTFSPPSLIEAADTPPFFHGNSTFSSNQAPRLRDVVLFYGFQTSPFEVSSGKAFIDQEFGVAERSNQDMLAVVPMLHVLNTAFNIDLALQRLDAVVVLGQSFHDMREDVQVQLLLLAAEEIEDAFVVMDQVDANPEVVPQLADVLSDVTAGASAGTWSARVPVAQQAILDLMQVRGALGSNINYSIGSGTLMY